VFSESEPLSPPSKAGDACVLGWLEGVALRVVAANVTGWLEGAALRVVDNCLTDWLE
jgi:hypothetical protein